LIVVSFWFVASSNRLSGRPQDIPAAKRTEQEENREYRNSQIDRKPGFALSINGDTV